MKKKKNLFIFLNFRQTTNPILILLLGTILYLFYVAFKKTATFSMKNPLSQFTQAKYTLVTPGVKASLPTVSFKDVAGLKEAKIEIMEFIQYLREPARFVKLGAKVPKGALLLGPPGCGKTLLAKALAAEAGVPFFNMAGTDFIEVIGGVGASRVRDLFAKARKCAPCIIFIDEIDAIGKKRSSGLDGGDNSEMDQTLNQLLSEMDGLETRGNVIVLGSTNRPDVLDKALLRPGRLDRKITIDLPTYEERIEIIVVYLRNLKLGVDVDKTFISELAHMTARMSGADLANVCNEAALNAARYAKNEVVKADFESALEKILSGPEKKTSSIMQDEQKMIAYYECGRVLISWLLNHGDKLHKVSLVPRTKSLAMTRFIPQDKKLITKDEVCPWMFWKEKKN
jgi:spastic paraplegia protein 7